jgi:hypothetical protein
MKATIRAVIVAACPKGTGAALTSVNESRIRPLRFFNAEHATIAAARLKASSAVFAVVEELAGVRDTPAEGN